MSLRRLFALTFVLALSLAGVAAFWSMPLSTYAQQPPVRNTVYLKSHRVSVTIDNQIAITRIEQVFVNGGAGLAEGVYLFPLPTGAAVSDLTLTIDGQIYKPQLLSAQEAQQIYTNIVRQRRDPVLLQYVGRDAIQANIFPIPAGAERKIEITYSNIVAGDGGLYRYIYPLKTDYVSALPVLQTSVSVTVTSKDPISTFYSPNPLVATTRLDDRTIKAGFEGANYLATDDFALYYGVASKDITANLLTYRAGANEDGFYMLMLAPPTTVDTSRVIPKDVILVLDQSGSMQGEKWKQTQAAARFVLSRLNPQDRFNAIVFSTGYRLFANGLQPISEAQNAARWIDGLEALGGTDINLALTSAAQMADPERQTTLLFMTDGLPSEGVTDPKSILANVDANRKPNLRLFAFGVGNDVDTFLLDSLSSRYGGTSVYVRPLENIEEKVSALYSKVISPVLTNIKLDFGSIMTDDGYPSAPLPDLFAGQQLILVGRYRAGGPTTITLTGSLNGTPQTLIYEGLSFSNNAGGQAFIPRLWATRKIGALTNQIRLNGARQELVDGIVQLSIRYGIITPYTSFLIQENDMIPRDQQPRTPMPVLMQATAAAAQVGSAGGQADANKNAVPGSQPSTGAGAVESAATANAFQGSGSGVLAPTLTPAPTQVGAVQLPVIEPERGTGRANEPVKQVNDRAFVLRGGVWMDTRYTSDTMRLVPVTFLSDEYFKLLETHPELKDYLAIGDHLIVVVDDVAYEIKPA